MESVQPRRIRWLPFIGWSLKTIDQQIKQYGLQEGWYRSLGAIKIKLDINLPPETKNTLTGKPTILIGNHLHQLEWPALLASSPKRNNSFVIAMAEVLNLMPSLDRHSLKAYGIRNTWVDSLMMFIVGKLSKTNRFSKSKSHQLNISMIKEAVEKITRGGLVTIMPGPHAKKHQPWKPRLGHIITQALSNKKQIFLVKSYTSGSTNFDFLCFFPLLRKLLPTLKVYFSKPILVTVSPNEKPREIVERIRQNYWQWVDTEVIKFQQSF